MIVEFQIALEGELAQIVTANMLDMKASISSFAKQLYAEAETMQSDKIEQSFQETENRDIDIDVDKLSDQDVERMLEQLSADDNENSLNE